MDAGIRQGGQRSVVATRNLEGHGVARSSPISELADLLYWVAFFLCSDSVEPDVARCIRASLCGAFCARP